MTGASEATIGSYTDFMEACAGIASEDPFARRIRERGHAERENEEVLPLDKQEAARKDILLQLDPVRREAIAQLLEECRRSAIHDLLAKLEWMMSCDDFKIVWKKCRDFWEPLRNVASRFHRTPDGVAWAEKR